MASIAETAKDFFTACETGKGWDGCKAFCKAGATFRCDERLAKISRRHSDRASPPVGKLHNDVGGTSCRALGQRRKLATE